MRVKTRDMARGKWLSILPALVPTISDKQLSGVHTSCPACGGKDRFRFDNRDGSGSYFCSQCGSGDGVRLVAETLHCSLAEAMSMVDRVVGTAEADGPSKPDRSEEEKVEALRRVWNSSRPLDGADPASAYLKYRVGVIPQTRSLRVNLALSYRDEETGKITKHPGMIAAVQDQNGQVVSLHRTYLSPLGRKAAVPVAKKLMEGRKLSGGAIRLGPIEPIIGIAEGIETALAASQLFAMPVWSAVSANGIESFAPPAGVQEVYVFADNDENYVGQAAAYALAKRLVRSGLRARVETPNTVGEDWADVLRRC